MNVFFMNFYYFDIAPIINMLNNQYSFNKVVCVDYKDAIKNTYEDNNLIVFKEIDIISGRYNKIDWESIPPLSRSLVEDMSYLERVCMKMFDRFDNSDSYSKRKLLYLKHLRFWNYVLDNHDIAFSIFGTVPHQIGDYIVYELCKYKNIPKIFINLTPVPEYVHCEIDVYENHEFIIDKFTDENIISDENLMLSEYMNNYKKQMYLDNTKGVTKYLGNYINNRKSVFSRLRNLFNPNKMHGRLNFLTYVYQAHGLKFTINFLLAPIKKQISNNYYNKNCAKTVDFKQRYIYVPLHAQPEASTCPLGNVFVDQLLMLEILSYCLKDSNIKIYVKEHIIPSIRKRDFYKSLLLLNNVTLIKSNVDSHELQKNCLAAATVNGTVIMECLFKFKPVLVFGSFTRNQAPNVYKVSDHISCTNAINQILSGEFNLNAKDIDRFLYVIDNLCIRGYTDRNRGTISKEENLNNIFKALKHRINEILDGL